MMKSRLLLMFVALFVLAGGNRANAQAYSYDVNHDGQVTITDAMVVINHILGIANVNDPVNIPAEAIDLGLPSKIKWASYNVGATKPEGAGCYYSWGDTEERVYYDWNHYVHCDGSSSTCHDLGSDIGGTEYDVAHVRWGGKWRMPSPIEVKELIDNCTHEWTTLNGVRGQKFTSNNNGASIFIPAAGNRYSSSLQDVGTEGLYWVSKQSPSDNTYAYLLFLDSGDVSYRYGYARFAGFPIRPVTE